MVIHQLMRFTQLDIIEIQPINVFTHMPSPVTSGPASVSLLFISISHTQRGDFFLNSQCVHKSGLYVLTDDHASLVTLKLLQLCNMSLFESTGLLLLIAVFAMLLSFI